LYKLDTIETKEVIRIWYDGFLFPHEYSGEGQGAQINPLYSIRAASFVSIVLYLILIKNIQAYYHKKKHVFHFYMLQDKLGELLFFFFKVLRSNFEKKRLISDGHQYQQNKHAPLTSTHWTNHDI
jgi:hypothetical protein